MRVCSTFTLGSLPLAFALAPRAAREKCPHWQHTGCLADVVEKVCGGDGSLADLFNPREVENVHMCCCPLPYQPCAPADRDAACVAATSRLQPQMTQQEAVDALFAARAEMITSTPLCQGVLDAATSTECWEGQSLGRGFANEAVYCEMMTWQWEQLGDGNPREFKANNCPFAKKDGAGRRGDDRKGHSSGWAPEEL